MTKFSTTSSMDLVKSRRDSSKETAEVDQRDTVSLYSDTQLMLTKQSKSLMDSSLKAEKFSPDLIRETLPRIPSKVMKRPEAEEVEEEEEEEAKEVLEVDNERILMNSYINPLLIYEA